MLSSKNVLVWGSLGLGALLILVSFYLNDSKEITLSPTQTLARVEPLIGSSYLFRASGAEKEKLAQKTSMGHLDSIETSDLGEVRLYFESLDRVRVFEHSLITLERIHDEKGSHTLLILKRGQIQIENYGQENDLMIAKNGQHIPAIEYHKSSLGETPVLNPEPSRLSSEKPLANTSTPGLTEAEVQNTLSLQRSSFLKCYAKLLQKSPEAKGDCTLTFNVENSGKLSAIQMTSHKLTDPDFKNCLIEVLSRIEFREFKGPALSTYFPLKFE